jgi:hypothetical protein
MPTQRGFFVVGEYLERTSDIVDGKHISLSQKIVECHTKIVQKGESSVMAYSDNPIYEPYEVMFSSFRNLALCLQYSNSGI